jgi:hypothetical protein
MVEKLDNPVTDSIHKPPAAAEKINESTVTARAGLIGANGTDAGGF